MREIYREKRKNARRIGSIFLAVFVIGNFATSAWGQAEGVKDEVNVGWEACVRAMALVLGSTESAEKACTCHNSSKANK